jgi:2-amino-4-hydroxy-6-hydroxymethyldihydropteridine diphosphokinase
MNFLNLFRCGARVSAKQEETADRSLILIGLGANLPSRFGAPRQTIEAALAHLQAEGVAVIRQSGFWHSPPQPISSQPWFINAVAAVATRRGPASLLALLHHLEAEFGRIRRQTNAARPLDLDLLAYRNKISHEGVPVLPHPRLTERAFVLMPLAEIAPRWCHPVSGESIGTLVGALPPDHRAQRLSEGPNFCSHYP